MRAGVPGGGRPGSGERSGAAATCPPLLPLPGAAGAGSRPHPAEDGPCVAERRGLGAGAGGELRGGGQRRQPRRAGLGLALEQT